MKTAQFSSFQSSELDGRTLYDLYQAIQRDMSLGPAEQQQLIQQIKGVTGDASPGTPLSTLLTRGLGGVVGYLISKYFGMSPVGQIVGAALGVGLGKTIYDQFNKPKSPFPGWKLL